MLLNVSLVFLFVPFEVHFRPAITPSISPGSFGTRPVRFRLPSCVTSTSSSILMPMPRYLAGADFHLGCIEAELGNPESAHVHLTDCLRRNPGHRKARQLLHKQSPFQEIRHNVFERIDAPSSSKILFILFGAMGDVIEGFPVVAALRKRFPSSEIAWMTMPQYSELAQASAADYVCEAGPRGIITWDRIEAEGFTHIFYPEANANQEEWQPSGLHIIDFMAQKCGVELERRRPLLDPGPEALLQAEEFITKHGIDRKAFLSASHVGISNRYWPHSSLIKVVHETGLPTVVFGAASDPHVPGTISCFGQSLRMVAALIRWSNFYVGPDSGVSWIAATTETPMGVFLDPQQKRRFNTGFQDVVSHVLQLSCPVRVSGRVVVWGRRSVLVPAARLRVKEPHG